MPTALAAINRKHKLAAAQQKSATIIEKSCRITLSQEAPMPIDLEWCRGRGAQNTLILLGPGESVIQPLDKCHAWFGPFDRFDEYENELQKEPRNERIVEALEKHIAVESARFLERFDYPYEGKGFHPDMSTPIGPHRAPNVTIEVIDPNGEENKSYELHKLYGIGKYDTREIRAKRSVAEIEAQFREQLQERDREVSEMRRELAKMAGMVQGVVATGAVNVNTAKEAVANG